MIINHTKRQASKLFKLSLLILFAMLQAACQSMPTIEAGKDITHVNQIKKWTARGKMMVADSKDKVSGYFYWQQDGEDFDFSLDTIIGTNIFSIAFSHGMATVEADGEVYRDADPQRLIYQLTGHIMPINQLPNWLLARIDTQAKNPTYDANNKILSFRYMGSGQPWVISYRGWTTQQALSLPQSIMLTAPNNRVKISISDWQVQG